jgi:small-conductance mechanosensitive channel
MMMLRRWWAVCVLALGVSACALAAQAQASGADKPVPATFSVANRDIAVLRADLLGNSPATRVTRARERFAQIPESELKLAPQALPYAIGEYTGYSILVGDRPIFTLLAGDLDPEDQIPLPRAAQEARARLADAMRAKREQRALPVLLQGLGYSVLATVLLVAALGLLRRVGRRIVAALQRWQAELAASTERVRWEEYLAAFTVRLMQLGAWALALSLLYAWLAYVLAHFPLTQPLGDRLALFVESLLDWLANGILASVPGIVTVVVVMFVTRAIIELIHQFFQRVQTGEARVAFVHPETASATRRIAVFVTWVLALVVAYPFIPGSSSDAFKGLSVLFGIVISLGSSGLVTQMMSGLVVVYSRALRKGDFVAVNGIEGVVSEIGALATKVVAVGNKEVTIPNSVLVSNSIHNYSKQGGGQATLLSTKVTIGYDAPWRQVHAMLTMAAGRTPGVRGDPAPYVYQRALDDFYVEYELFAQIDHPAERVPKLSALHANIQDVFNEYGVQIMSPHFELQPPGAVLVPRGQWHAAPATRDAAPD